MDKRLLKRKTFSGRVFVKRLARAAKRLFYICLGSIGNCVFFILRGLKIVPQLMPFSDEGIKKILIIRMDRIGDCILSTPAFRAVRKHFPQAEICLLLRSYTKDLMENNPAIDKLIIFDDKMPFFSQILEKVRELKIAGFDLAIVLHPNFWVNALSFASGAKYRLGFDSAGSGFFLTTKIIDTRKENPRHEVEVNLDVLRAIGIKSVDRTLEVSLSYESEKFIETFLRNNAIDADDTLVVMHPGGYYSYTHWLPNGFASVADSLIDRTGAKVVIVGAANETALSEELAFNMRHRPIIATGKLTLSQLVSLIKRCCLFIGNSSGPMHIACALRVPVVAIFGNVHPVDQYKNWAPLTDRAKIVSKNLDCLDCQPSDCPSLDCLKLITAGEVLEAAEGLLRKNNYAKIS